MKLIIVMMILTASQTVYAEQADVDAEINLIEARVYFTGGNLAKAKTMTAALLNHNPDMTGAQQLMSEIIDREIAQEKDHPREPIVEDFSAQEKKIEIDRWMERAKTYFSFHQYQEAYLAAEKVFQFDPTHAGASRLLDEIRQASLLDGRKASALLNGENSREIYDRIQRYRDQASQWIKSGRLGAAKLALNKLLLLDPQNRDALKLKEQIRKSEEHEERKVI